ncbi:MAG: hypothetical protein M5U19_16375, partial [Microthrixaceae bacterium]|nr:hypothetical protein [Microthrixaceae bacterium]
MTTTTATANSGFRFIPTQVLLALRHASMRAYPRNPGLWSAMTGHQGRGDPADRSWDTAPRRTVRDEPSPHRTARSATCCSPR